MLILKIYPGQITWIAKDIQITVLGNSQKFVRWNLKTGQLQNIAAREEGLWDKKQAHETL